MNQDMMTGGSSRPARDAIEPQWVVGPTGEPLTRNGLPTRGCRFWTARRKAEVVAAYVGGLFTIDEVLSRYDLTVEEFAGWQRAVDRFGLPGLRQTRLARYRSRQERDQRFGWMAH